MPAPINDTPKAEHVPNHGVWLSLLDEFRAMGGVVENIALQHSSSGSGLFAEDPTRPVLLRAPDNLLYRAEEIALSGDSIRIAGDPEKKQRERDFFARYQAALSWGRGGHEQSAGLIDMFDGLPQGLRSRLAADFGMSAFIAGGREERGLGLFVRQRTIRRRRESVLVPFLDLLKRSRKGLYARSGPQGEIQIHGRVQGEILLADEQLDPLAAFNTHGQAGPRPQAISLPTRTKAGPMELVIGRDPTVNTERADFRAPQMRVESDTIHLSYLTLGNAKYPRMPRGIFNKLMQEAQAPRTDALFDRILFTNRSKFLSLVEVLEPLRGELASRLRAMAHFQLAALAECLGALEL